MKFYEFNQNNSGGSFTVDKNVCHRLLIEANSVPEANAKAEELGCYFGGEGDCPCCGDRWYSLWADDKGLEFPHPYGGLTKEEAEEYGKRLKVKVRKIRRKKGQAPVIGNWTHEIILEKVEQYAQFVADKYGWTKPDVRIFYANGKVKEIFTRAKKGAFR